MRDLDRASESTVSHLSSHVDHCLSRPCWKEGLRKGVGGWGVIAAGGRVLGIGFVLLVAFSVYRGFFWSRHGACSGCADHGDLLCCALQVVFVVSNMLFFLLVSSGWGWGWGFWDVCLGGATVCLCSLWTTDNELCL